MRILLVAATEREIAAFRDQSLNSSRRIDFLITGVGMVSTAFAMGRHLATNSYDLAVNAGIAGSFDFGLPLGEVCQVIEDTFADFGAEDGDDFISIKQLGFGDITFQANPPAQLQPDHLRPVKAITVNKVHGHEFSIARALARFKPQVESMEGAAFFYACHQAGVPALQIRSVSNYVERRNREKWDIPLAITSLNKTLAELLHE